MKKYLFFFMLLAGCVSLLGAEVQIPRSADVSVEHIKLPQGFRIEVFANAPGARSLALGKNGTVFVGTRDEGKVFAIQPRNGARPQVFELARGLTEPNGVAFLDGDLYVAERHRVIKYEGIEERLVNPPQAKVFYSGLPSERWHGWKYIGFDPNKQLYVAVGVPCNVCARTPQHGGIYRFSTDGKKLENFAKGIRNSVGFDWHPETGEMWFSDNGRDMLGDDVPPDELNHAPKAGLDFGFPYCHGNTIRDPEFGRNADCKTLVAPARELGAHVAALGVRFYSGKMFPKQYHNQIFIAEHGSWNRSSPVGYKISLAKLEGNKVVSYETFAEGWLRNNTKTGRPVDLLVLSDGSMLVSDDSSGVVYRISYKEE